MKDVTRPWLFKSWIALSAGQITIQRISIKGNQLRYRLNRDNQVDSVIHLSNNRGQDDKHPFVKDVNLHSTTKIPFSFNRLKACSLSVV